MFGAKESVVIVEAKGCGKYCKQLYTLIGTADDNGEEIVGPVDGSVEASVFDDKRFAATPLSSDQKIIFVGRPKSAKDYLDAIETEASVRVVDHGIRIFVSGRQASIDVVGNGLGMDEYWDFLDYAKEHGQDLEDLLKDLRQDKNAEQEGKGFAPLKFAGKVMGGAGANVTTALKGGDIRDQQFRFAIKCFYLEHLRAFVEA